jgi:hypothetical protein
LSFHGQVPGHFLSRTGALIFLLSWKELLYENADNFDADAHPSCMELTNEPVKLMLMPLVIRMMMGKVKNAIKTFKFPLTEEKHVLQVVN